MTTFRVTDSYCLANADQGENANDKQRHLPAKVEGDTDAAGDGHERVQNGTETPVDCLNQYRGS